MYRKGETTGSNQPNRKLADGFWEMKTDRTAVQQEILFDPQTSGGLLLSLPADRVDDVLAALKQAGVEDAVCIGNVVSDAGAFVKVV